MGLTLVCKSALKSLLSQRANCPVCLSKVEWLNFYFSFSLNIQLNGLRYLVLFAFVVPYLVVTREIPTVSLPSPWGTCFCRAWSLPVFANKTLFNLFWGTFQLKTFLFVPRTNTDRQVLGVLVRLLDRGFQLVALHLCFSHEHRHVRQFLQVNLFRRSTFSRLFLFHLVG